MLFNLVTFSVADEAYHRNVPFALN